MTTAMNTAPTVTRSRQELDERARRFRAALALTGMSVREFAAKCGVKDNHVFLVVRGARASARLDAAIDALIAIAFPRTAPLPPATPSPTEHEHTTDAGH